jgi:hypothetical protein
LEYAGRLFDGAAERAGGSYDLFPFEELRLPFDGEFDSRLLLRAGAFEREFPAGVRLFEEPPKVAGPRARRAPIGLRRLDDWATHCQIPVARVRDPWHSPVPTSFSIQCSPADSRRHRYSPMHVH